MSMMDRKRMVCIGKVLDSHGLKGELKVMPLTDVPEYYEETGTIILESRQGLREYDVRAIRSTGRHWILTLAGVTDRDGALALKGAEVLLDESDLKPLEPGEYFMDDLIGCDVVDLDDSPLGQVGGLIETGANDVLEVVGESGRTLVPMTEEVLREVNVQARRIRIAPLPGLFGGEPG